MRRSITLALGAALWAVSGAALASGGPDLAAVDRARALDPANDTGVVIPRADTVGDGRFAYNGFGAVGLITTTYGTSARTHVSLTTIPLAVAAKALPVLVSGKWAFVRQDHLVVSAQAGVGTAIGAPSALGAVGTLVDWRPDARGAIGVHGTLHVLAGTEEGEAVVPFPAALLTVGASWRATDWLVFMVDGFAVGTPDDSRLQTVVGAGRIAGIHWALDLGATWQPDARRDPVLPTFALSARY